MRRRWILVPLLILSFGVALPAGADGPVLHELVPPDPDEDVSLAATTLDGNLPAALDTPSGVAEAPDPRKPPDLGHIYTGGTTDDSPDDTLEPDRDTRQPKIENYDDPFSPSTAPFKRLRAYDSVDERYTLRVARKAMSQVPIGGEVAATDEAFYGDMSVELLADDLVRVPSVGPGTRVIKMHVEPDSKVSLLADGADNWFLRGSEHKRVRVVMQLAIPRATFGSDFRDVDWSQLGGLPAFAHHPAEAEAVFAAVGINRGMRPKDVVGKMVEYFRAFVPTNEPLRDGGDVYKDVALSKKGVCRHRAFAFMVTALEIGIPARMVVNEAHAWVEVFDGELWHRIDLGGAALDLDQDLDPTRPQHKPPDDPYAWPDNQAQDNSGQRLADRQHQQPDDNGTSDPGDPSSDPNGSSVPDDTSDPSNPKPSDPSLPASTVELELVEKSVKRGQNLRVVGKVLGPQEACRNVRVDVVLRPEDGNARAIGSVSTDEAGAYDGIVVVPRDVPTGDYTVFVSTRGDQRCGAGRSD